jgi:hypothetical protein
MTAGCPIEPPIGPTRMQLFGDLHDRPNEESNGVVLVLDGEGLLVLNYDLVQFCDPVWGEGECDWENEIECWDDIEPLEEVLIAVEPQSYQRLGFEPNILTSVHTQMRGA